MRHLLLLALLLAQDKPADQLKKDGWAAVRALASKGAEIKPALEEAAKSDDTDVAFYAKAALSELDAGKAVLTTEIKEAPVKDVIGQLFKLMERRITLDGVPDKTASIPAGLTLLEALEKVSNDAGIDFTPGEDQQWHVSTAPAKAPRFAFGWFRARLESVRRTTQVEFHNPTSVALTYSGYLEPDPLLKLTDRWPNMKVVEAVDDTGENLKKNVNIGDRYGGRLFRVGRETNLPFTVTIAAPGEKATKLTKLRLSTEIACERKRDTFSFEKVLESKGAEKTIGEVTAVLKDVSREGDEFKIELEITAKGNVEMPEWETIKLTDSGGGEYQRWSSSSSSGGKKATYKLGYRNPGALGNPSTFSFSMVTQTAKRTVYLEFRDVPIK
jgi:hypothetical protein